MKHILMSIFLVFATGTIALCQKEAPISAEAASGGVPTLVRFNGVLRESDGLVRPGIHGVIFGIYKERTGGIPTWSEARNVNVDSEGHFSVLLGSQHLEGLPAEVFQDGEYRWVGITPEDGMERTRMLLTTSPYAFTAVNSHKLGGRPASDFVTREQLQSLFGIRDSSTSSNVRYRLPWWPYTGEPSPLFQQPVFEATAPMGPSFVSDATSGPIIQAHSVDLNPNFNADLLHGLNDTAFAKVQSPNTFSQLQTFLSGLQLPPSGTEPNTSLIDSAHLGFSASAPDPQSGVTTKRTFEFSAKPITGQPSVPSARLSLSYGLGDATLSETGFWINSDGTINFAPNQLLPAAAVIAALGSDQNAGSGSTGSGSSSNSPQVDTVNYAFNQTQTVTSAPVKVGNNESTMSPCPAGVNGTDLWHYLYLSGSGTPEVVLITGGTCTSRAASGTIQFSAQYDHPAPFTVSSATDGVQEAVIDASTPGSYHESRIVTISPGTHLFRARMSIRTSNLVLSSSGAIIVCSMKDTCVMLGDPADANPISKITVDGLRFSAGVPSGTWPALEDNANGSTMTNIAPARTSVQSGTFGSLIQIDNDQAATIDRLDTVVGPWARCDQQFCSTAVVGPGPFGKNAGVIWIRNSNFGLMCAANAVDNQNGNTLRITDSVIEGYAQFAVRSRTTFATANVTLTGVYTEVGGCINPLGTGQGGLIVQNGSANISGTVGPDSQLPHFSNSGTTRYYYYIVANSSMYGASIPYLAGYADTDGVTPFKVIWNQIGKSGVITYDVLRIAGDGGAYMSAPSGPGSYAVALGVAATTACSNTACSITDTPSTPAISYTALTTSNYVPGIGNWPAGVVLTSAFDVYNSGGYSTTKLFIDQLVGTSVISASGAGQPSVFAQQCAPSKNWTSISMQCMGGDAISNNYAPVTGTLFQLSSFYGNGGFKGRLIFQVPKGSGIAPTHVITLLDSNVDKTSATPNNRPTWDPNDTFIGLDNPVQMVSKAQLSFGAPVSISNYIGNDGDNINWLERLTAKFKAFQIPVQISQLFTGTTANSDLEGTLTISGTTSATQAFSSGKYTAAPGCVVSPLSDPTLVGAYWINVSSSQLTIYVRNPSSISFNYQCIARTLATLN